ncbi:Spore coat protein F-like protein YhcQ [Bacillus subtilis subsp. subtilis]|nr:spore gernimation protein GerQ [Bacillus subtilis]ARW30656.1 Spore coat protein F-like protein YhcQ [Bacillus subtilis subsp. subtilis]
MDQFNQQQQSQMNKGIPGKPHKNHGGHEMFDMHEVLSGTLTVLDQFLRQFCKDQELLNILDRAECFKTGSEPSQKTATYMMKEDNQTVYGMQPSQPKKPVQSMNDIDDSIISRQMLCAIKAQASMLTMASLEMTNPAVRRVLSAQIQEYVEMAFEIFLYQNKHGYYQVPQLDAQDMEQLRNSFAPAQGQMPPTQVGMAEWVSKDFTNNKGIG